jgi:predicted Fe-Mo cluster-binding NifX family protein
MKVVIPHWQGRVSPVFDVAGNLLLVDVDNGTEQGRENARLDATEPEARARRLAELGAEVLVCGAISWPLEAAIAAAGVKVIPQICGEVEQVLAAFLEDRLAQDAYRMPGAAGGRQRFRTRCRGRQRRSFYAGGHSPKQ